ncbi:alpha/beta fold hydrolase [Streptomyces sp. ET3-23]|uniref:alpha/beta hydrolase n=1 Tax=Streptomyces sp. ET3-23 TaxID=2885643 RepID=UPI001D10F580|nr:alpha/beta fold hydrolase [Streptomyces sp. ET3-23]MCC2279198.1 alpha/beta fold hydrolase [Streptomyces sp. ET3-23]
MLLRRAAAAAVTTVIGAGAAAVAAGRYAGDAALKVPAGPLPGEQRVTVHAADAVTVTLTRTPATLRPGTYGLAGPGLHAVTGPVVADISHPHDCVVRHLESVAHGALEPGDRVWLTPELYTGGPQEALGIHHADVDVAGELGPLPAWFVPGVRDTWVIAAHGLGTTRAHPLNVLPFLQRLRFPVLSVSCRGDPGAPRPPHGIGHFGAVEWRDLDAAVRHALHSGARRTVLYGWSTGATTALLTALDSAVGDRVSGLVLDSPVLDWQAALRSLARHRARGALLGLAVRAAEGRTGLTADGLFAAADTTRLTVPALVLHGTDDTVAPPEHSRELVARRPDLMHLHTVRGAGHAGAWNADPQGCEEALRRFLTPLM